MCYLCLIYMYYFKHISFLRRVRLNIIRSITHSYLLWCEYNSGRHLLLKNVLMLFITSMDNDRGYRYCNMRNNLYLNFASRIIVIWQRLCFSRPDIIFSRLAAMYNMTALVEAFFLLPRQKKKNFRFVYIIQLNIWHEWITRLPGSFCATKIKDLVPGKEDVI